VHPDTIALVSAMVAGWRTTGGLFDPSVLPALVRSGYDRSVERLDVATPLPDGPLSIGGVGDIEIDVTASTVRVPQGTVLDPGGIGKGLAADLAVAALLATDARGALVGIGGDLSMAGEPVDRAGWPVIIEQPDDPSRTLLSVVVDGGGVATSSCRSRRWIRAGQVHHHVIDPTTGTQADPHLDAVTVVAASGCQAEVHATGALLSGRDGFLDYLKRHQLSGLAVSDDGTMFGSDDLVGSAGRSARSRRRTRRTPTWCGRLSRYLGRPPAMT
jgi:thiamine biosynthesis lipoprotein